MVIWGRASKSLAIRHAKLRFCKSCGTTTRHRTVLVYRYAHIFWIFRQIAKRVYYLICEECSGVSESSKQEVANITARLGRDPIPWGDRYSGLGLMLLLLIYMVVVSTYPCIANNNSQACQEYNQAKARESSSQANRALDRYPR